MRSGPKTVIIVEDDAGLRNQLVEIVGKATDIKCLYAVGSGEEALERILKEQPPDVVLMDIRLPGISGIECVAALKQKAPWIEIVMLTVYEDADSIFRALKAGANGYLIKSSRPNAIFQAIRDVHSGGAPFSTHIARKVVHYFQEQALEAKDSEKLSPRESEVIRLLAAGYIYKEIADRLEIGVATVRTYVKNICAKMHVRNRVQAVAKYRA
jgi:DNA-binding NarL/FixJ family response regulator